MWLALNRMAASTDACRVTDSTVGSPKLRRACVLVTTLVVVMTLSIGAVAQAVDTFRFHGSGYGHGIGMSQWGANGLAQEGWSHRRILEHFYSRTRVVTSSTLPKKLRVGLTAGRPKIHIGARSGPVKLWLDGP